MYLFNEQWAAFLRYKLLRGFWKTRPVFYRDTATAIKSNEALPSYLEGEMQIARDPKTANPDRAKGFAYASEIQQNSDLSLGELLNALMPRADALALSALQKAKDIPKALNDLAKNIEQQQAMATVMRKALLTPTFIVGVAFAFAYIFATQVIPAFEKAAPEEVWLSTYNNMVRQLAYFVNAYGLWAMGALLVALVWAFLWGLPNLTANWRYKMENSRGWHRALWVVIFPLQPLFSLYRDVQGTNMLGSLANLMQGGAEFRDALGVLSVNAQPWLRKHLAIITNHLDTSEGDYVGAFAHGVLPSFLLSRMGSLMRREAGQLDKVLVQLGVLGADESRDQVEKSATAINGVLVALGLGVILFFYIGQGSIISSIREQNSPSALAKRQFKKEQQGLTRVTPVEGSAATK